MAITKRLAKGSALTHTELDGNFTDLDGRVTTLESASDSDSQTLTLAGDNLTISGGNTVDLSTINSTGILNVVEDTTPQLGGNLDLNSNEITGSGGSSISETLSVLTLQGGSNGIIMRSTGTGQLVLGSLGGNVVIGNSSNTVEFVNGVDVDLTNTAVNFTGATVTGLTVSQSIDSLTDVDTSTTPPGVGQVLKWDGSASKWLPANDSSGSGGITLSALSVTQASAGTAGLVYNNVTGVFTYTPPDLSSYSTFDGHWASLTNISNASGPTTITIGKNAGTTNQGATATAIGSQAGETNQGINGIAIGQNAGKSGQGERSIAIGRNAGTTNQGAQSIIINATGGAVENTTADSLVIKPIRNASGTHSMEYNPTTGEVTYDTLASGGASLAFSNIAVAGQTQIIADGDADTLTIEAGSGMTITTDAATDKIIFASSGGSGSTAWAGITDISNANGPTNVIIGKNSGAGASSISIGEKTGQTNPGSFGIAIGNQAGSISQGTSGVAIGSNAGFIEQSNHAVAIGISAGSIRQGDQAVAIGRQAGEGTTHTKTYVSNVTTALKLDNTTDIIAGALVTGTGIATGTTVSSVDSGTVVTLSITPTGTPSGDILFYQNGQRDAAVAVGDWSGKTNQGASAVALGHLSGLLDQGDRATALGNYAGARNQSSNAVAIGYNAAYENQGSQSIAIGASSANNQGTNSIAIGASAGANTQGNSAIAIGVEAGNTSQSNGGVAVGEQAGKTTQGMNATAVGGGAGTTNQGESATALGVSAGLENQGADAVAIGAGAGFLNQAANSIVLNATGSQLNNTTASSLVVKPIRNAVGTTMLMYDATSGEVTHTASPVITGDLAVEENYSQTPTIKYFEVETGAGSTRFMRSGINMSGFGTSVAPKIDLTSYRASPADGDAGPELVFRASTAGSTGSVIATIETKVIATASGAETTEVSIHTDNAGTSVTPFKITGNTVYSASLKIGMGVEEKFATTNGATGVTALDCSTGHVHYLTAPAGDITANFTNLNLTAEYATNVTVVINQGGTEREITAVQIGGVAQTIVWQGNSAPTGTANGVDSFSFTILNDGGTYVVLGQMVAFGGV